MNDLISRQAAIDALRTHERKASKKWFDNQLDIEWNNAIDICCYDIEDLPSAQPEIKPIDYQDCANAMLRMWMGEVITDGEYNRVMDKLNAFWRTRNERSN